MTSLFATMRSATIFMSLLALPGCFDSEAPPGAQVADALATSATVTIMTFNVQNLFDNIDDPGKDDKAYLPIAAKQAKAHIAECNEIKVASWRNECLHLDWSDIAIDRKLTVLAEAIKQVNDGQGADIIAFQEVENVSILNRLRTGYLADSGYLPAILIEGDDRRGIDVGFLSKLPLAEPAVLHQLAIVGFPDRVGDTRGILQATFELPDGSLLTGFAVHFPAPFHPTAMRVAAYEHLFDLRNALPDDHYVFAAGDFNTTSKEDATFGLLDKYARPHWTVAHDIGCDGCRGSYFYHRDSTWSFLDMILFSSPGGKKTTWRIRADSVQIANRTAAQVSDAGRPLRYDAARQVGVSDHWPLVLSIEPAEKQ
ncbi:MAG: endonuclease/exonuclease/phosphatase family protein [Proteobacteria bacterium]|nr:endonuclease/exonuclease/phosphatase family protein [Pseudomonadota bacterium]